MIRVAASIISDKNEPDHRYHESPIENQFAAPVRYDTVTERHFAPAKGAVKMLFDNLFVSTENNEWSA